MWQQYSARKNIAVVLNLLLPMWWSWIGQQNVTHVGDFDSSVIFASNEWYCDKIEHLACIIGQSVLLNLRGRCCNCWTYLQFSNSDAPWIVSNNLTATNQNLSCLLSCLKTVMFLSQSTNHIWIASAGLKDIKKRKHP